jgi:hypothetical protein
VLVALPSVMSPGARALPTGLIDVLAVAMWLGDAWFAIVAFRLAAVTRVGSAALLLGSVLAIAGIDRFGLSSISIAMVLAQAGIVVHGVGWILLGLDVALRRRPAAAPTTS